MNSYETAYEKGYQIGIKLEVAKKSLAQGIDIKTVALITGLSVEEIRKFDS